MFSYYGFRFLSYKFLSTIYFYHQPMLPYAFLVCCFLVFICHLLFTHSAKDGPLIFNNLFPQRGCTEVSCTGTIAELCLGFFGKYVFSVIVGCLVSERIARFLSRITSTNLHLQQQCIKVPFSLHVCVHIC